ncbi:MAG: hypothetical protein KDB61_14470, partial [Planctomycetes bacterium]|nr:hypothetical protein [Planctomycetota bacterium]
MEKPFVEVGSNTINSVNQDRCFSAGARRLSPDTALPIGVNLPTRSSLCHSTFAASKAGVATILKTTTSTFV